MKVPAEVIFYAQVAKHLGGLFEGKGSTGRWFKGKKTYAEWKRGKDGKAAVKWHIIKADRSLTPSGG